MAVAGVELVKIAVLAVLGLLLALYVAMWGVGLVLRMIHGPPKPPDDHVYKAEIDAIFNAPDGRSFRDANGVHDADFDSWYYRGNEWRRL